jgi:hypothetical protein
MGNEFAIEASTRHTIELDLACMCFQTWALQWRRPLLTKCHSNKEVDIIKKKAFVPLCSFFAAHSLSH